MTFQIEDLLTRKIEEYTEEEAVAKFGAGRFNEILAGIDADYVAYDLSVEPDLDESMDGDHASALASAGWGTDEDYGYCGDDFF